MTISDCWRRLGLPVSQSIVEAGLYLESRGQKFLVDFGIENAIQKAADEFTRRAEQGIGK